MGVFQKQGVCQGVSWRFQEHPAPRHSCNVLHFYFVSSSVESNLCARKFLKNKNNFKKFKKLQISCLFCIHFWECCGFELNIIEWKFIWKILGCNKVHPRNMIYDNILWLMCSILFIFCIKSQIPWINSCKIKFVDFQWGNGWSFIDAILWTNFQKANLSFKSQQSETKRGSLSFRGRSFSRLKNKLRHCTSHKYLYLWTVWISFQAVCRVNCLVIWPHCLGNVELVTWECRHDNMNSTIWQCGLAKSVKSN
jgi:hypothetical protein